MREEIESGIKNAVERGDSLEDAINSFINAGYNPVEVREAAKNISGASQIVNSQSDSPKSQESPEASQSSTNIFNETKRPFEKPPIDNMEQMQSKFDTPSVKRIDSKTQNPQINPKQDLTKVAPKRVSGKTIMIVGLVALIVLLFVFLIGVIVFKDRLIAWLASS